MKDKVTIEIEDAESVSADLSDLLCWWEGFKTGMRLVDDSYDFNPVANNGIRAARELNIMIKTKLRT